MCSRSGPCYISRLSVATFFYFFLLKIARLQMAKCLCAAADIHILYCTDSFTFPSCRNGGSFCSGKSRLCSDKKRRKKEVKEKLTNKFCSCKTPHVATKPQRFSFATANLVVLSPQMLILPPLQNCLLILRLQMSQMLSFANSMFTAQPSSTHTQLLKCCFTSTETVGSLGTGAQDVHLDFHTAPEL